MLLSSLVGSLQRTHADPVIASFVQHRANDALLQICPSLRMMLLLAKGILLQTSGGLEVVPLCHVSFLPLSLRGSVILTRIDSGGYKQQE